MVAARCVESFVLHRHKYDSSNDGDQLWKTEGSFVFAPTVEAADQSGRAAKNLRASLMSMFSAIYVVEANRHAARAQRSHRKPEEPTSAHPPR